MNHPDGYRSSTPEKLEDQIQALVLLCYNKHQRFSKYIFAFPISHTHHPKTADMFGQKIEIYTEKKERKEKRLNYLILQFILATNPHRKKKKKK